MDILSELKKVPLLQGLPDSDFAWLVQKGRVVTLEEGDTMFSKGKPIDYMRVILKGKIDLRIDQAGQNRSMGSFEEGDITGVLPYSRLKTSFGEGLASEKSIVFEVHKDHFPEMIRDHHELTSVLVHSMTDRVRDFTRQQQQNDKMASLGKLSAGLAHELNNPSAAVVRSARELKKHLGNLPEKFKGVIKIRATDENINLVNDIVFTKIQHYGKKILTLMQRTEKEDTLTGWLEDHKVEDAYSIAETFTEFGIEVADLEKIKSTLREEDYGAVINWVNQVLNTERLVNEIEEASKRINDLVTSIKSYTHMDQAPEKKRTDVRVGIRNTITMLIHKLKKNNIKVIENFEEGLPEPAIFISEMNQVWTNLIDNAIDAMEGRTDSRLELRSKREKNFIHVSVIDNGPGIPESIRDKIFDPFYTTKPVGKGTGLGLDVVRQIISQHNGEIYTDSRPGFTEFKVCIPID